jgi:hypothetical protein
MSKEEPKGEDNGRIGMFNIVLQDRRCASLTWCRPLCTVREPWRVASRLATPSDSERRPHVTLSACRQSG